MGRKVSVIIPVYNVEQYLDRCMESVVSQSFKDMEILLINDGSTDNSGAVCRKWSERDSRIRYMEKENEGLGPTREYGLRNAEGECILFVDSDDWIEKDYVGHLAAPILSGEAEITVCDYRKVWCDEKDRIVRQRIYKTPIAEECAVSAGQYPDYIFYGRFFMWLKAYKKELLIRCGVKQPADATEDSPVSFIYLYRAAGILHIKETLYNYRQRPGSLIYSDKLYRYAHNALRLTKENIDTYVPELKGSYITKKTAAANVIGYRFIHGEPGRAAKLMEYFYELFVPNADSDIGCLKCCVFGSYNLRVIVNELEYMPPEYFGFSSLIGAMAGRKRDGIIIRHGNIFREEALCKECEGEFMNALFRAEYLFLDLLEERFDVISLSDGTYLTDSEAFREAAYDGPEKERLIKHGSSEWRLLWKAGADKLAEEVKKADIRKVILVQTRLAECFGRHGKEEKFRGMEEIRCFNEELEWMEQYLADRLENVVLVPLPQELLYTDVEFAYGCYPWHLNEYLYCRMPGIIREALSR